MLSQFFAVLSACAILVGVFTIATGFIANAWNTLLKKENVRELWPYKIVSNVKPIAWIAFVILILSAITSNTTPKKEPVDYLLERKAKRQRQIREAEAKIRDEILSNRPKTEQEKRDEWYQSIDQNREDSEKNAQKALDRRLGKTIFGASTRNIQTIRSLGKPHRHTVCGEVILSNFWHPFIVKDNGILRIDDTFRNTDESFNREWNRLCVNKGVVKSHTIFVQNRLNELGHKSGKVDGIIGKRTIRAIKAYQSAQGLKATGQIDDETLYRLEAGA